MQDESLPTNLDTSNILHLHLALKILKGSLENPLIRANRHLKMEDIDRAISFLIKCLESRKLDGGGILQSLIIVLRKTLQAEDLEKEQSSSHSDYLGTREQPENKSRSIKDEFYELIEKTRQVIAPLEHEVMGCPSRRINDLRTIQADPPSRRSIVEVLHPNHEPWDKPSKLNCELFDEKPGKVGKFGLPLEEERYIARLEEEREKIANQIEKRIEEVLNIGAQQSQNEAQRPPAPPPETSQPSPAPEMKPAWYASLPDHIYQRFWDALPIDGSTITGHKLTKAMGLKKRDRRPGDIWRDAKKSKDQAVVLFLGDVEHPEYGPYSRKVSQ